MSLEKIVIDNIKRIRKEKGISQEKLAELCNTATSYIGLMEIYKNVPKLSTIEKIANALEVEPQILFINHELPSNREKEIEVIKDNILKAVDSELKKALTCYLPAK